MESLSQQFRAELSPPKQLEQVANRSMGLSGRYKQARALEGKWTNHRTVVGTGGSPVGERGYRQTYENRAELVHVPEVIVLKKLLASKTLVHSRSAVH